MTWKSGWDGWFHSKGLNGRRFTPPIYPLYAEILLNVYALRSWGMAGKWMRKVRLRLHNRFSVQSIGRSVSHPICTSPQGRIRTANVEGGLTSRSTRS